MKVLILGLLVSLGVFANEYQVHKVNCVVSGDQSSISSPSLQKLYNNIRFSLTATTLKGKNKILKLEKSINNPFENLKLKIANNKKNNFNLKIGSISKIKSEELLKQLGAKDVPSLPKGFILGTLKTKKCHWSNDWSGYKRTCKKLIKRSQVHFDQHENDGLSFHVQVNCN